MKWDVIFGGLIGAIFGFIGAVLTPFTDRLRKLIDERIIAPPHLFKLPLSVNYDIVEPKLPRRAIWIRTTFPRPSRGRKDVKTLKRDTRRVKLRRLDRRTELSFSLPIHAHYSTQFKLFAQLKKPNDGQAFEKLCRELENSRSRGELTEITPVEGFQIWLVLNPKVFTMFNEVEDLGFKNNWANKMRVDFPVRADDRNSASPGPEVGAA